MAFSLDRTWEEVTSTCGWSLVVPGHCWFSSHKAACHCRMHVNEILG